MIAQPTAARCTKLSPSIQASICSDALQCLDPVDTNQWTHHERNTEALHTALIKQNQHAALAAKGVACLVRCML